MNPSSIKDHPRRPRPWSVTFLAIGVLILAALYLTRLGVLLFNWEFWSENLLPFTNVYFLLTGIFWGVFFAVLAVGIWIGASIARKIVMVTAVVYLLYYWLEQIILTWVNTTTPNTIFLFGVSLFVFGWVIWILNRPKVKQFFGDNTYEQRIEN